MPQAMVAASLNHRADTIQRLNIQALPYRQTKLMQYSGHMDSAATARQGEVTIPGQLVRYLRRGVKRELLASLVSLAVEVETNVDPKTYTDALTRFEAAQALLQAVGLTDEPHPCSVQLDLARWPRLILTALEHSYNSELSRVHGAEAAGTKMPRSDLTPLSELIAEIRIHRGIAPRAARRWRISRPRRRIE
jgi:hypothetical protein